MTSRRTVIQFIWPWLIGLIFLTLVPLVVSLLLSFTQWDGFSEQDIRWVGWRNYEELFAVDRTLPDDGGNSQSRSWFSGTSADPQFAKAVYNTLIFSLFAAPLGLITALLLAVLLNQKLRGMALFRCAYYMPHILGGVGTILVWQWLFHPDAGLINAVLRVLFEFGGWIIAQVGLSVGEWSAPRWLHSPRWCKPALVMMHIWGSGGAMLIFLAALQNVPERLYDAARIDGAGHWHRFRHITVPQISPVILFNLVIGLIGVMRVFRSAYVLRHWSQQDGLLFYMLYLYENAFEDPARLGYASALCWVLAAALILLTFVTVWSSRRWVHYEG